MKCAVEHVVMDFDARATLAHERQRAAEATRLSGIYSRFALGLRASRDG